MTYYQITSGCLRCLLLVMCTYPFAKKPLTLHLARSEGRERYFGCNLMQRKVLAVISPTLNGGSTEKERRAKVGKSRFRCFCHEKSVRDTAIQMAFAATPRLKSSDRRAHHRE